METTSKSARETKKFAQKWVKETLKVHGPVVFSLEGELGTGKTTFTQGFAVGLGIKEKIQSPTFVILKIYKCKGQGARGKQLVHVDAYRLKSEDFKVLGWKNFIKNPNNIILVEWGNKIKNILPKNTIRIIFKHGKTQKERLISIL